MIKTEAKIKQIRYFKLLSEAADQIVIVVDRFNSFDAKRVPYYESKIKGNIIGRLKLNGELLWDFDSHTEDNSRDTITRNWLFKCSPEAQKLKRYCKEREIPVYFYDSQRGIHAQIVTSNLVMVAERRGIKLYDLEVAIWKIINRQCGVKDVDPSLMKREGQSVVRACGGFNPKTKSYKTFIEDLNKKEFCVNEEDIKYPTELKTWEVPEHMIRKALEHIRLSYEKRKGGDSEIFSRYQGKHLELPCCQNLLKKPIPQTGKGTRNTLAFIVAYNAYLDFKGDEEKVKEVLRKYAENCRKLDSDFSDDSAICWYETIMRKGIENCVVKCGMIKHFEKILREQGNEITLCEPEKCRFATKK